MNYNVIIDFVKKFGWELFFLSLSGIVLLGLLKWFGCFRKLKDEHKKYVYFGLSCLFSIIACTIYLLITHNFHWLSYLILCIAVIGLTIVVYSIYEHTGARTLWKKVLDSITRLFKFVVSNIVSKSLTTDTLKNKVVELGSETLIELVKIAQENEEKAKAGAVDTTNNQ